ncbi:hypothetical protein L1887_32272 [Cichorium endivia]|nr:hypothetical protein L1887_32272 [Cichorium endivia]
MNPVDIYSIVMKLHSRAERHKDTKEAYLAANEQFQELVDLSMPDNRNNWRKGVTNDHMLGLVYKDPAIKGSFLFLRAE